MKFESLKCDECGRIQDISNHWIKLAAHYSYLQSEAATPLREMKPNLIALGQVDSDSLILGHSVALAGMKETTIILDLCGQACAIKHLGKLLGWSAPTEGA
jgi:hypothetical protein